MRRIVFSVAMSLDGFIAGPKGEYDWIAPDPGFDFVALFNRFDTLLMGRRTYEVALTRGEMLTGMGKKIVVASTTLDPRQHPKATIISRNVEETVAELKAQPGKDIWLMGGAVLFRLFLDAGLVDGVEVSLQPILLGGGVRVLPDGGRVSLNLESSRSFPNGMLALTYSVPGAKTIRATTGPGAPRILQ